MALCADDLLDLLLEVVGVADLALIVSGTLQLDRAFLGGCVAEATFQPTELFSVKSVNEELVGATSADRFRRGGGLLGRGSRLGCLPTFGLSKRARRQHQSECAGKSENAFASNTGCFAHAACQHFPVTPTSTAREFFRSGPNSKKSLSPFYSSTTLPF